MTSNSYVLRSEVREDILSYRSSGKNRFLLRVGSAEFEITEELSFLVLSFEKTTDVGIIASGFEKKFGQKISCESVEIFRKQCIDVGILEVSRVKTSLNAIPVVESTSEPAVQEHHTSKGQEYKALETEGLSGNHQNWLQSIFKTQTMFLADKLKKNRKSLIICWYIFSPLVVIAILSAIANWRNIFYVDGRSETQIGFLVLYVLNLLLVQYTSLLVLSASCYAEGGYEIIDSFKFKLKLGFLPRFNLSRAPIYFLPRSRRVGVFASPLIAKLIMFAVFLFISTNMTLKGTLLSYIFLSASHAALIELVLSAVPLAPVDGYGLFVSAAKKSPLLYRTARSTFIGFLKRVQRPNEIPLNRYKKLVLSGFIAVTYYIIIGLFIAYYFADLVVYSIGNIIGPSTLFCATLVFVLLFLSTLVDKVEVSNLLDPSEGQGIIEEAGSGKLGISFPKVYKYLGLGLCALLIPVPFSIGGRVVSLSDNNTKVTAQEDGFISEVPLTTLSASRPVEKGSLLFRLTSPSLSDERSSAKQLLAAAHQQYIQQQEALKKLENAPDPDDIDIQRKKVETVLSTLKKQKRQLIGLKAEQKYAELEVSRYHALVAAGAASQQDLDKRLALSEAARSNTLAGLQDVETQAREYESERFRLIQLEKGAAPEDIAKAKAASAEAMSRLSNEEEKIKAIDRRIKRLSIYMPYTGYVVTPRLSESLYSRVKVGDELASIYARQGTILQMRLPEFDTQYLKLDNKVEIRLAAFPGRRFTGVVISINRAAVGKAYSENEEFGNEELGTVYVDVQINTVKTEGMGILPGMTGYGKVSVGTQPLLITLTRPLQRFLQVDFWTWFP